MATPERVPHITVDRSGFPKPPVSALAHVRSPRDGEFLRTFLTALSEHGIDNNEVVFRGFDGFQIKEAGENPDFLRPRIWVMDKRCWQWAIDSVCLTDTAVNYAEYHLNPCVGVYDLNQLRVDREGEPNVGLPEVRDANLDEGICKLVTHIDYPRELPEAALQALVFFDYGQ